MRLLFPLYHVGYFKFEVFAFSKPIIIENSIKIKQQQQNNNKSTHGVEQDNAGSR